MAKRTARRKPRRDGDHLARINAEEGWSSYTASRYRRLSRPTSYTWSGLREIMGAVAWVAVRIIVLLAALGLVAGIVAALLRSSN
jgi:hypothetical protein